MQFEDFGWIVTLAIFAAIFCFFRGILRAGDQYIKKKRKDALRNFPRVEFQYDADTLDVLAISVTDRKIALGEVSRPMLYDLKDIREWELNWMDRYTFGPIASHNRNDYSIKFHIKDINNPTCVIKFPNRKEAERWFEILRQAFEGTLSAPKSA